MSDDWNSARRTQATLDETYMQMALEEARAAERGGEVPVGCVITLGQRIIACAVGSQSAIVRLAARAKMVALRAAAAAIGNHRLLGTTLYATIEPCAMCSGAILQARVARLVYGANDTKGGAVRSCFAVFDHPRINHRVEITAGVYADEAAALLQTFFAARR